MSECELGAILFIYVWSEKDPGKVRVGERPEGSKEMSHVDV